MGGIKEEIAEKLPGGSKVGEMYPDPADTSNVIIEYTKDNAVVRITPERVDIKTFFEYRKSIALVEGLTFNDVYEIVSRRHAIQLIKDIDYEDNPELVPATGRYRMPIHPNSLRFTQRGFNIDIIDPNTAITGTEEERTLTDVDLLPANDNTTDQLRFLALRLHDFKNITCFEDGQLTVAFRKAVAEQVDEAHPDVKKEILSSFLLKGYSDRLSDVVLLVGPSEIPYIIRYESAQGDVP